MRHLGATQAARAPAADLRAGRAVPRRRSREAAHPRLSGGALHDGRHPGRHGRRPRRCPACIAAGECASVGIHGANRLGSNSLSELCVFGKMAGIEAAAFARSVADRANRQRCSARREDVEHRLLRRSCADGGTERSRRCATRWRGAWRRAAASTASAADDAGHLRQARELKQRYRGLTARRPLAAHGTPNGCSAIELGYQLDVAQAMAHSAINRRESRGAHQRLDGFDTRDDAHFLKHTLAHYRRRWRRRASITVLSPSPGRSPGDAHTVRRPNASNSRQGGKPCRLMLSRGPLRRRS